MKKDVSRIGYLLLSLYAGMISWYYNKDFFLLLFHVIIAPFYLLYKLFIGDLAGGRWLSIPLSYFN